MLGEHVWSFSQAGDFLVAFVSWFLLPNIFNFNSSLNLSAGYNYYGTERMYSGTDGREFEADIFFGVVYYQRLRHMVADKYQVIKKSSPSDPLGSWSRFVSRGFAPVNDDIMLCVSSDWLLQLCHVVSTSVLLVIIHRHFLFSSQLDKNLCLILVSCTVCLWSLYLC